MNGHGSAPLRRAPAHRSPRAGLLALPVMPGLPNLSIPSLSPRSLAGRTHEAPLLVTFSVLVGIAAAGVTSTIRALPLNPLPTPQFSLPFAAFGSDSTPDPIGAVPGTAGTGSAVTDRSTDARASRSGTRTPLTGGEFAAPAQAAPVVPVQWTRDTAPDAVHWSRYPVTAPYQQPVVQPVRGAPPVSAPSVPPAQPFLLAPSMTVVPTATTSPTDTAGPTETASPAPTSPTESAPATDPTGAPASTSAPAAAPVSTAPASTDPATSSTSAATAPASTTSTATSSTTSATSTPSA